jgi:muconate cycloisomerase
VKIRRIVATEVVVPARPGTINSPSLDRPLHKLPVAGQPAWSKQFDQIPKCLLTIEFDNDIVGLGELYRDHDWRTVEGIARSLLGRELSELCRQNLPIAWCREYDGFECALWDAYAKSLNVRLVDLLGGPVRDRVKIGAWSGHRVLEEVGRLAADFAEQGYDCLKFKCDLEDDVVGWCAAIADAAPGMQVILDPNERWERPAEARRRIDGLAEVGNILCLEDPIPRWMLPEFAKLRQYGPVPIVLHVSLPYIYWGQRPHDAIAALQHSAVDGFNFNAGIASFQRLDAIAHAANLPCWHGSELDLGVAEAMYVHCCAAASSCQWPSDIFGRLIREHDLLRAPLRREPPFIYLPSGPGLGVEIDTEAAAHYQTNEKVYE